MTRERQTSLKAAALLVAGDLLLAHARWLSLSGDGGNEASHPSSALGLGLAVLREALRYGVLAALPTPTPGDAVAWQALMGAPLPIVVTVSLSAAVWLGRRLAPRLL